jgi:hypothetical protein
MSHHTVMMIILIKINSTVDDATYDSQTKLTNRNYRSYCIMQGLSKKASFRRTSINTHYIHTNPVTCDSTLPLNCIQNRSLNDNTYLNIKTILKRRLLQYSVAYQQPHQQVLKQFENNLLILWSEG